LTISLQIWMNKNVFGKHVLLNTAICTAETLKQNEKFTIKMLNET